jgi:hypothetical protein
MAAHRLRGLVHVPVGDGADDLLMLREAVMIRIGARPVGPQPAPGHRAAHGVQRVEHREQQGVAGCLRDGAVQPVIP